MYCPWSNRRRCKRSRASRQLVCQVTRFSRDTCLVQASFSMGNKVIEGSAHRDPHQDCIENPFRWGGWSGPIETRTRWGIPRKQTISAGRLTPPAAASPPVRSTAAGGAPCSQWCRCSKRRRAVWRWRRLGRASDRPGGRPRGSPSQLATGPAAGWPPLRLVGRCRRSPQRTSSAGVQGPGRRRGRGGFEENEPLTEAFSSCLVMTGMWCA